MPLVDKLLLGGRSGTEEDVLLKEGQSLQELCPQLLAEEAFSRKGWSSPFWWLGPIKICPSSESLGGSLCLLICCLTLLTATQFQAKQAKRAFYLTLQGLELSNDQFITTAKGGRGCKKSSTAPDLSFMIICLQTISVVLNLVPCFKLRTAPRPEPRARTWATSCAHVVNVHMLGKLGWTNLGKVKQIWVGVVCAVRGIFWSSGSKLAGGHLRTRGAHFTAKHAYEGVLYIICLGNYP